MDFRFSLDSSEDDMYLKTETGTKLFFDCINHFFYFEGEDGYAEFDFDDPVLDSMAFIVNGKPRLVTALIAYALTNYDAIFQETVEEEANEIENVVFLSNPKFTGRI